MASLTEQVQTNIRGATGTSGTYNEDWHALCDLDGIPEGQINERILAYFNSISNDPATASSAHNYFLRNPDYTTLYGIFRAGNYAGALYLPKDITSLFQDSAGTTPVTAVTDPIGLQQDLSGNGNHSIQATPAARPTWQVDANGKYYTSQLGTDDCFTCATGGGGTTGFLWCGAIQPTGGAGTGRQLWSDAGTNTGYYVRITSANKLVLAVGNGAITTFLNSTADVSVGTLYLLTVWDDGTNLNVQINSAAAESVARPVVAAGTAGFTRFKDNGAASSFFIGYEYASVYFKDTGLTAAERAAVQALVAACAGITL